ncbi:MAG: hypothetical protein O7E51_10540 [Acidobacteria bacterium]|nr:hypothetical protein [Acidobacteriota bacterium]
MQAGTIQKKTRDREFVVHPEYFDRIKGKIEEYLLAKADDRSEKPLECPVCEGIQAYPGDTFGNLVPDCNPVGGKKGFNPDAFSGEHNIGEYPWAMTHARHLATELARFLDTFSGVVVSHRDPLDFTPQEVLIRDALNHSKATRILLESLNEQYR